MISSRNQNQFSSSFATLGNLLKALMFLLNLNGFNYSPSLLDQGFAKWKGSSKVWRENGSKWFSHFFSLSPFLFLILHYLCVLLSYFESVKFYALLCLPCFCLFIFFNFALFFFSLKKMKNQKNTKTVCVCVHWYLCTLDGHWNKVF